MLRHKTEEAWGLEEICGMLKRASGIPLFPPFRHRMDKCLSATAEADDALDMGGLHVSEEAKRAQDQ